jgi:hypothetical protein
MNLKITTECKTVTVAQMDHKRYNQYMLLNGYYYNNGEIMTIIRNKSSMVLSPKIAKVLTRGLIKTTRKTEWRRLV